MGYANQTDGRSRIQSLAAVIAVHGLFGLALMQAMGVDIEKSVADGLTVIAVNREAPAEPAPALEKAGPEEGSASAQNRKAKATEIAVPEPEGKLKIQSPVVAATKAGSGHEKSAGASAEPGPGSGSGGEGSGTGSGRSGDGSGAGGILSGPRHKSGAITRKDLPREVWRANGRGQVVVHFTVEADGRVSQCRVRQSSGYPALDATTCQLIEQRFRFEPARDTRGKAVAHPYGWIQEWWLGRPRR